MDFYIKKSLEWSFLCRILILWFEGILWKSTVLSWGTSLIQTPLLPSNREGGGLHWNQICAAFMHPARNVRLLNGNVFVKNANPRNLRPISLSSQSNVGESILSGSCQSQGREIVGLLQLSIIPLVSLSQNLYGLKRLTPISFTMKFTCIMGHRKKYSPINARIMRRSSWRVFKEDWDES
jgi:hypothetical protein